ncbi:uncharacterized protein LOC132312838 isoform X2 [Cornus florida]|nr:uncharacterized protein LOC132312838 isoform X2 [Cornus florida]
MYPIERFLRTLKQYVRNKARPEGSIVEAYVDSECVAFYSLYLRGVETCFNREERNFDKGQTQKSTSFSIFTQNVRPLGYGNYEIMDSANLEKAHFYVLNNCPEVEPFLGKHMEELKRQDPNNVVVRHSKQFTKWFEEHVKRLRQSMSPDAIDDLYSLACGLDSRVKRYTGCVVNGTRFHTKEREKNRKTQNNGVMVKGENIDFYGCLTDIIEVSYDTERRVVLFRCDWCNTRSGIQKDKYFTSVNLSRQAYKDEPFVLAHQAKQVLYLKDNKLRGEWEVVQQIDPRNLYDVREKDDKTNGSNEGESSEEVAYQDFESLEVNGVVRDIDFDSVTLTNDDMVSNEIDSDAVHNIINNAHGNDDVENVTLDYETSDEEDASNDDSLDEEDIVFSDDDTDIE